MNRRYVLNELTKGRVVFWPSLIHLICYGAAYQEFCDDVCVVFRPNFVLVN